MEHKKRQRHVIGGSTREKAVGFLEVELVGKSLHWLWTMMAQSVVGDDYQAPTDFLARLLVGWSKR
jgi:hypothetical protein